MEDLPNRDASARKRSHDPGGDHQHELERSDRETFRRGVSLERGTPIKVDVRVIATNRDLAGFDSCAGQTGRRSDRRARRCPLAAHGGAVARPTPQHVGLRTRWRMHAAPPAHGDAHGLHEPEALQGRLTAEVDLERASPVGRRVGVASRNRELLAVAVRHDRAGHAVVASRSDDVAGGCRQRGEQRCTRQQREDRTHAREDTTVLHASTSGRRDARTMTTAMGNPRRRWRVASSASTAS
jgi:hypothetical protein